MNITATQHDDVSALVNINLDKADYKEKIDKTLINYAKTAQMPGFRKGKVPLSIVKRKYEAGVAFEEINKIISDALNQYITDNKLRLIGRPVPVPSNELNYEADSLQVGFEIGYEPEIEIEVEKFSATHYVVEASDKEVAKSIENMQKRFATQEAQDTITDESFVTLTINKTDEETAENEEPLQLLIGKEKFPHIFGLIQDLKMNEKKEISIQEILDSEELSKEFSLPSKITDSPDGTILVEVSDFHKAIPAEINQDLFDKVYGKDVITSEENLKERVKTELDEYFQQSADVLFVNKVIEKIVKETEVKLPEEFLVKWLIFSKEGTISEDNAREILAKEKEIIKAQIIEGMLLNSNGIQLEFEDVLQQAELMIKNQLAMYGMHDLPEEEVRKYAVEHLKDEERAQQMGKEVAMMKLKEAIMEKAQKEDQVVSHDEFQKIIKKENEANA